MANLVVLWEGSLLGFEDGGEERLDVSRNQKISCVCLLGLLEHQLKKKKRQNKETTHLWGGGQFETAFPLDRPMRKRQTSPFLKSSEIIWEMISGSPRRHVGK